MRILLKSPFITLLLIFGLYLSLTLPALLSSKHFLYNLEPYPDAFYYLLPPVGLLKSGWFGLIHNASSIQVTLPPLYSIVLTPLIAITSLPVAFYLTNLFLGLCTLFTIWMTIWLIHQSTYWAGAGALLALAHGYIIWLPAVPMAENLSLTLFGALLCLTAYLATKKTVIQVPEAVGCGVLICALPWTKFSLVLVAFLTAVLFGGLLIRQRQFKPILAFALTIFLGGVLFLIYEIGWLGFNPMDTFQPQLETKSNMSITAFSWSNVSKNAKFYSQAFWGSSTRFLWQSVGLTSGLLTAFSLIGAGIHIRQQATRWVAVMALLQIAGLISMQLPFYVADARYVAASLPALVVLGVFGLQSLVQTRLGLKGAVMAVGIVLISLGLTQYQLLRQVIASNILHRSRAWQYESIQQFNTYFTGRPTATLITVLPPYLIDIYRESDYRVLPLSLAQEFMNARQRPWGELGYDNLISEYQERLAMKEQIFVTNAYLSSQHEFDSDWQRLGESFRLELVREGCFGTCNIYKLEKMYNAE